MPVPVHGASSSTKSADSVRSGSAAATSARANAILRWPRRLAKSRAALSPRRLRSNATTRPRAPAISARWVVLPPGAAAQSITVAPADGDSIRATSCEASDCGWNSPERYESELKSAALSSRAVSGRPSPKAMPIPSAVIRDTISSRVPRARLRRITLGAASLSAAISASARITPNHSMKHSTIHRGCEYTTARYPTSSAARSGIATVPRAARRSTALTNPPAPRPHVSRASDTEVSTAACTGTRFKCRI